jgi:hypothetical protein
LASSWKFEFRLFGTHTEGEDSLDDSERSKKFTSVDLGKNRLSGNVVSEGYARSWLAPLRPLGLFRSDVLLLKTGKGSKKISVFRSRRSGNAVTLEVLHQGFTKPSAALSYRLAKLADDDAEMKSILKRFGCAKHKPDTPSTLAGGTDFYFWTKSANVDLDDRHVLYQARVTVDS